MKFLALMAALWMVSSSVSAQSPQPSSKVTEAFTQSELSKMTPSQLEWNNFLAEQWCVVSINTEKSQGLPVLSMKNGGLIAEVTPENFNPFEWNVSVTDQNQHFRIDGTDLVVFAYSQARLEVLYDRYVANQKATK